MVKMNLDKEIQCNKPCWDDKVIRSDVLRGEMLMSFMLDLLFFPGDGKSAVVKYASCHPLDSYVRSALQGPEA